MGGILDLETLSALFIGFTGFVGIVVLLDTLFGPSDEEKKEN